MVSFNVYCYIFLYKLITDLRHQSGEDGEQTDRWTVATSDVGRGGPVFGHATRGHVPLVTGEFRGGRTRHIPRTVDRTGQLQIELQFDHNGRPMFAYPTAVVRHADDHHWRHHAVLDLAIFAEE